MVPAVEIAIFPANEAYRKDPSSTAKPLLDIVASTEGVIGTYYGLQSEDGKTGYIFVVWESLEAHHKVLKTPTYPLVVKHVSACIEGTVDLLDMFHVYFEPSVAAILNGSVTSLALVTKLKPGKTGEGVTAVLSSLASAKDVTGCRGGASGKVVEKEGQFAFVTGWEKLEDHATARKDNPAIVGFLGKLNETVAEWSAKHVSLICYKKFE